jgi:hypothetical protein
MTRTGHCLCGQISYELSGDLIATAVCHCDHCQRQSGGAFSVNLIAMEGQMDVVGSLSTFEDRASTTTTCTCDVTSAASAVHRSTRRWPSQPA